SESNPGEGDYLVPLPTGAEYAFNVSHPGYLFYSDHFIIKGDYSLENPYNKDIPLVPIEAGKSAVLNNIFFDFDSYKLREESKVELNLIVDFLKLNENIRIEISGHTDNTGSDAYNLDLSKKRAEEVVGYLVSMGIEKDRLESKGYGSSKPVSENNTEQGRAKNRRTEMKIL
ncbi:MAG TPA: OmpA family protein, partial [Bacteroidales bacterium]|nr:OmpA family protein [Bacteroidales bacterium]